MIIKNGMKKSFDELLIGGEKPGATIQINFTSGRRCRISEGRTSIF